MTELDPQLLEQFNESLSRDLRANEVRRRNQPLMEVTGERMMARTLDASARMMAPHDAHSRKLTLRFEQEGAARAQLYDEEEEALWGALESARAGTSMLRSWLESLP